MGQRKSNPYYSKCRLSVPKGLCRVEQNKEGAVLIKIPGFIFIHKIVAKEKLIIALRKGLNSGFKYDTKHCICSPIECSLLYIKKLKVTCAVWPC